MMLKNKFNIRRPRITIKKENKKYNTNSRFKDGIIINKINKNIFLLERLDRIYCRKFFNNNTQFIYGK